MNWMRWMVIVAEATVLLSLCLAQARTTDRRLALAGSSAGRVALHILCAARDCRFRWHWRGVAREFRLV